VPARNRGEPAAALNPIQEVSVMNTNRRLVAAVLALALLAPLAALAAEAAAPQGVINVNTASVEQLQLLPRIGPSVAQRIVEHREATKFSKLEDLMLVRGIGEATFAQLQPYVTLSGDSTLKEKVRVPRAAAEASGEDR
jgi:competence protein ComEA